MALPEHVKRQAMDAVSHKETTQQIRLYSVNHDAGQSFSAAQKAETASPAQRGAIPDHVKKQAMDAVSHKETTAQIRLYTGNASEAAQSSPAQQSAPTQRGQIPDHVKKQAMDAVSHKETTAQIQMVKESGHGSPTPKRDGNRMSEKIAQMHRGGADADTMHQQMTKDGFGR